jgi:hypothetical protein
MRQAATAIALGWKLLRRRPGLVALAYLAVLAPALLAAASAVGGLDQALSRSLFAQRLLGGEPLGPWMDFLRSPERPGLPGAGVLVPQFAVALVLQLLLAAGTVEALLGRLPRRQRPFLTGIGRHGWPFVRSALAFAAGLGLVAALMGLVLAATGAAARAAQDERLELAGWALAGLVGFLAFAALDLAYDLSRVAAASHGDPRMLIGLLRALRHVLRRPGALVPLYLAFVLMVAGVHLAYFAAALAWSPAGAGGVVVMVASQQLLMLSRAGLAVWLWGAEVSYYQGIGEPRWCAR